MTETTVRPGFKLAEKAEPCTVCKKLTFRYHTITFRDNVCKNDGSWETQEQKWNAPLCDACDEHLYGDD